MIKCFFMAVFVMFNSLSFAAYYSQLGQDQFINENYFKNLRSGFFVDIGAYDGITGSNSYFFEKELDWNGICVEPIPEVFSQLKKVRNCICVQGCVDDKTVDSLLLILSGNEPHLRQLSGLMHKYDQRHLQRIESEIMRHSGVITLLPVKCYLFNDLMDQHGITHVNFLSLDTEGGEFDIISSIDFSRYKIDVITLEDNYGDSRFVPFLEEKGYSLVTHLPPDLVFVHKDFQAEAL